MEQFLKNEQKNVPSFMDDLICSVKNAKILNELEQREKYKSLIEENKLKSNQDKNKNKK